MGLTRKADRYGTLTGSRKGEKVSRQEYLKKMEQKKLKELRYDRMSHLNDIEDEQYLFDGVKLTEAEYGELSLGLITAIIPSKLYFILLLIGSHRRGAVVAVVCSLVLVLVKRCYYYCIVAATGKLLMYGLAMNWGSCVDWLSGQFSSHSLATSAKKLMLTCTIYCIWQKRNARFFSSVCTPTNVVVRKVESLVSPLELPHFSLCIQDFAGCQCWSLVGRRVEMKLVVMDYVAIGCCFAGCDVVRSSSPMTQSKGKTRVGRFASSPSGKLGTRIEGHILFKQVKSLRSVPAPIKDMKRRLNYRSNIAGIVKIVSTSSLTSAHHAHLMKTPLWLFLEAILVNDLNEHEFRKCNALVYKIIQTYDPNNDVFNIRTLKLRDSDVRLVFGLQYGGNHWSYHQGLDHHLTLCNRVIDKLDTMKLYNWTSTIWNALVGSVKEFYRTPNKVTGCVVVLLEGCDVNDGVVGTGNGSHSKRDQEGKDENGTSKRVAVNIAKATWRGFELVVEANEAEMAHTNGPAALSSIENAYKLIARLEAENKSKDFMIAKLEDQVGKLMEALEVQASNLFVGFNRCIKLKEDEIAQLKQVITELKSTIFGLEDQLVGHLDHAGIEGHNAIDVDTGSNSFAFSNAENDEEIIHDVTQRGTNNVGCCNKSVGVVVARHGQNIRDERSDDIVVAKTDIQIDGVMPSYGLVRGKMFCFFWYFSDIRNLVRQGGVRGDVIDACAKHFLSEQDVLAISVESPEQSYFFNSICLDMMKHTNDTSRDKYIETHMCTAGDVRYIHFPMWYRSHWTLLVYDTESGVWKHFNSMRPQNKNEEAHFKEVMFLKKQVLSYVMCTIEAAANDGMASTQDVVAIIESVVDCPQHLDYAIIMCYVMRQYVHHVDIERTMKDINCISARAAIVRAFVDDPVRGLKCDAMDISG
ncbi:Pre-mRNA-splicing factor ATP-dependent RNA helicase DEAH1 [Camellia lanceoleosa]|uniref:Pre-mRNA-splicing factor ATP-dependent RNA helicase DEAH1 n=1 Tax=Camellia lanceoleosa TaxID=1840588 RepID=A0ACC0IV98_9ERIC|nr:Pre-mRNA-splicing factor ATP-dependent RNA helicase DEAH1 [Camellia lanceoleosa]